MNYKDTKAYMSAFLSVDLLTYFAAFCLTDFMEIHTLMEEDFKLKKMCAIYLHAMNTIVSREIRLWAGVDCT